MEVFVRSGSLPQDHLIISVKPLPDENKSKEKNEDQKQQSSSHKISNVVNIEPFSSGEESEEESPYRERNDFI